MKLLVLTIFALPGALLACGPFFYPAPPTLDHYPERLPVKTMSELLRETQPPVADAATFDQLVEETRKIGEALALKPADESRQAIERILSRNRTGEYRKRIANCLYDFRDLLESSGAPAAEVSHYANWRVDAMDWDDGFYGGPPSIQPYDMAPEDFAASQRAWKDTFDKTTGILREEVEKSSAALRPHWLVQAGAWQFKHGSYAEAGRLFEEVIAESPRHPRAEVAQLMLARVRTEQWRDLKREGNRWPKVVDRSELDVKLRAAQDAFEVYATAYPHGRFVLDIPGWRGGLFREDGDPITAFSCFLDQMDFVDHPEIVRRAVGECEACLDAFEDTWMANESRQAGMASALPIDQIARHPVAALAVVYHYLDAESRRDFNDLLERVESMDDAEVIGSYLPKVLRMRRAGREILPVLADAVAKRKENYGGAVWRPKYLAVLAWAASECGEQTQAIRLCELAGPSIDGCDDLLFVRAVALQRAGELAQAIDAFRTVREKHPDSPLSAEVGFRIATVLRDKHESGLAVVELARMEMNGTWQERWRWRQQNQNTPQDSALISHLGSEIGQWADTLFQFGPLAELDRGFAVPDLEPEIAGRLREILRGRYLAREDFAAAGRFAPPVTEDASGKEVRSLEFRDFLVELRGEAWRKAVDDLSRLKREIDEASEPVARGQKLLAMADQWASYRGRLTLPSFQDDGLYSDEFQKSWSIRYRNAQVAGFTSGGAAEEFDRRDELRHAFHYYLQAADTSPDKALVARALWRANDALRRMAELSPWSASRAFEKNDSALSRLLHERLLKECPASDEATRLSVWWSFPPPPELRWMPGPGQDYDVNVAIADAFENQDGEVRDSPQWENGDAFAKRLEEVVAQAGTWSNPQLLNELAAIRADFLPTYTSPRGSWQMNHIDDLSLFLHEPGLTPSVRAKYFAARLAERPPDISDPEMQPWSDYLAFLALVREEPSVENPQTGERRSRPMSKRMREFLDKFPASKKREAAMARLAIAGVRESRVHCGAVYAEWPEAPTLSGYLAVGAERGLPFDAKRVFAGLDAYEHEYPRGRYLADVRLWRGAASIDAGDWKTAVDLLVATLDDKTKSDLHLDAALNLADVFMRLLVTPEVRPEIIAAIRENPSAQKRLAQFAHSNTLGARLSCLDDYLKEQFGSGEVRQ